MGKCAGLYYLSISRGSKRGASNRQPKANSQLSVRQHIVQQVPVLSKHTSATTDNNTTPLDSVTVTEQLPEWPLGSMIKHVP